MRHFLRRRFDVKHFIDLLAFQYTPLPSILREKWWESMFTLHASYYLFLVRMFYVNMHTVSLGCSFWVTMFGQSFQITSLLVKLALSLPRLDACLLFFLLEVQSLTPRALFATFLTYSFYHSSHRTKIQ